MTDIEERKKQLVAEAEVYRETLKVELQNIRIYGINLKQRLGSFSPANPILLGSLPLLSSLLRRRRRSGWRRLGFLALLAWQWYQRLAVTRSMRAQANAEDTLSAAEEYLDKRI